MKDVDLSDLGAAIDIFEHSHLTESNRARLDQDPYFAERWRNRHPSADEAALIKLILTRKLPSILCKVYRCLSIHIFNESYIVKQPHSGVEFRWHTDSEEQLGALPPMARPLYYSAWCPLDRATAQNGTISFPEGTKIVELQISGDNSDTKQNTESPHFGDSAQQFVIKSEASLQCLMEWTSVKNHSQPSVLGPSQVQNAVTTSLEHPEPSDSEEGVLVTADAGTVVLFSSVLWHRSGVNSTDNARRVLYVQYSPDIITAGLPRLDMVAGLRSDSAGVVNMINNSSRKCYCNNSSCLTDNNFNTTAHLAVTDKESENASRITGCSELPYPGPFPLCFGVRCSPEDYSINLYNMKGIIYGVETEEEMMKGYDTSVIKNDESSGQKCSCLSACDATNVDSSNQIRKRTRDASG
jgi:hypothetical protein